MSATHGWKRSLRPLGCLMAVALLASALFASAASAAGPAPTPKAYVALGDSLSFGYKAATFRANQTKNKAECEAGVTAAEGGETEAAYWDKALCEPASSFEPGFVGYFGSKLAKSEKKSNVALETIDLGCPGETSDGLIGHMLGELGAENDPCPEHNSLPTKGYPLKFEIGHLNSQLEAAGALITSQSHGEVKVVSLQIGSNDELHVLGKCESGAYDAEKGFTSVLQCAEHEAGPEGYAYPGGLIHHILVNVGTIISVLRNEAGINYKGRIVMIGFYNPYATLLPGSDALVKVLNEGLEGVIAGEENVKLAQPFPLVNPEAPNYKKGETEVEYAKLAKKEAKAICKYTEMCPGGEVPTLSGDIHMTAKGYAAVGKLMVKAYEAP